MHSRGTGTEHTFSDQKDVRATAVVRGDACFEAYVYVADAQPGNLHQSFVTMRRGPTVCIPRAHTGTCICHL